MIPLFKVSGFRIGLDWSFFGLGFLLWWTLAIGYFPVLYPSLTDINDISLASLSTLGLLALVILFETLRLKIRAAWSLPGEDIRIYLFSGVGEWLDDPKDVQAEAKSEVLAWLAGFGVMGILWMTANRLHQNPDLVKAEAWFSCMFWLSIGVLVFKLFPVLPLCGGKLLRLGTLRMKKNSATAMRVTTNIGSFLGMVLTISGIVAFVGGYYIQGIWLFLTGVFQVGLARRSYRQYSIGQTLSGRTASEVMKTEVVSVAPDLSIQDLLNRYFYRHYFKIFPVISQGRLLGVVSLRELRHLDRSRYRETYVESILTPVSFLNTVDASANLFETFKFMLRTGQHRLLVTTGKGRRTLTGILTLQDILSILNLELGFGASEMQEAA